MNLHKLKLFIKLPLSVPSILVYYSLKEKDYIDADMERIEYGKGWWNLHCALNECYTFRTVFRMRVRHESSTKYALIYLTYKPMQDLELGCKHRIGKGLAIWHGYGSVIHCNQIGENCSIYQNVTIGKGGYKGNGTQLPNIGNNVAIYAGAIVIGGITIGDNCEIGAGAVVTKDVPPHSTVIGNPMRILPGKM